MGAWGAEKLPLGGAWTVSVFAAAYGVGDAHMWPLGCKAGDDGLLAGPTHIPALLSIEEGASGWCVPPHPPGVPRAGRSPGPAAEASARTIKDD